MKLLKGKTIVLGVTGGIACYKAVDLVSRLKKQGAEVEVIMTEGAAEFVTPLTFQTISQHKVHRDLFEEPAVWDIAHISLAKKADLILVAPATMNIIGKVRNGIADDLLTTTIAATKAPVMMVPAMNTNMFENPICQKNIEDLRALGYLFMEPAMGLLACGDEGKGKFPEPADIAERVVELLYPKDLLGKKVLVTAGPTREKIDPVRFITNHSTGKMGYDIAYAAGLRGADVTLVSGPVALTAPKNVTLVPVSSALEMRDAVLSRFSEMDAVIKTAAVGDYRPKDPAEHKLKKKDGDMFIELTRNDDILKLLGEQKGDKVLIGFAAESQNVEEYALKKLREKNLDLIVANNVLQKGAGFGGDTNIVDLYFRDGRHESLEMLTKAELGFKITDQLWILLQKKGE